MAKKPTARDIARKTLEDKALQHVLANNHILENQASYGQIAVNGAKISYNEAMNSEKVRKIKDALYKEKLEKGRKLGVYGLPSITDYDVSTEVIEQIEENKSKLPLKDLEEIVKNIGNNFGYNLHKKFKLSKEIENYVPAKLEEKIQVAAIEAAKKGKKISPKDVLDEKEKYAWDVYQFLSQSYNHAVALSTCNYFADLNELGRQIMEKYEPKEKKKE